MLFLEGAITQADAKIKFSRVKAPSHTDMEHLVHVISHRIAAYLEKAGLIERDVDRAFLAFPLEDEDGLLHLQASSLNYRIAVGKGIGKKVFSLQTLLAKDEDNYGQLAKINGFSLHAGVFADTHQSDKLERLCRYIARPALSEKRLSLTSTGNVRYELKTPYKDGTTHFFRRLTSLVSWQHWYHHLDSTSPVFTGYSLPMLMYAQRSRRRDAERTVLF